MTALVTGSMAITVGPWTARVDKLAEIAPNLSFRAEIVGPSAAICALVPTEDAGWTELRGCLESHLGGRVSVPREQDLDAEALWVALGGRGEPVPEAVKQPAPKRRRKPTRVAP